MEFGRVSKIYSYRYDAVTLIKVEERKKIEYSFETRVGGTSIKTIPLVMSWNILSDGSSIHVLSQTSTTSFEIFCQ